jgi:hypothetical protein
LREVHGVIGLDIAKSFRLLEFNRFSIVFQINTIPRIFLLKTFVLWLLLHCFVLRRRGYVLEPTTILPLIMLAKFLTKRLFLLRLLIRRFTVIPRRFHKLPISKVHTDVLSTSPSYVVSLNVVLDHVLFLLDGVLGKEAVGLNEEDIDFGLVQDARFLDCKDNFFIVSRLEGGLEGA